MNINQKRIRAIETSKTMSEASVKAHTSRQNLYWWLKSNGLTVVRDTNLKVVALKDKLIKEE